MASPPGVQHRCAPAGDSLLILVRASIICCSETSAGDHRDPPQRLRGPGGRHVLRKAGAPGQQEATPVLCLEVRASKGHFLLPALSRAPQTTMASPPVVRSQGVTVEKDRGPRRVGLQATARRGGQTRRRQDSEPGPRGECPVPATRGDAGSSRKTPPPGDFPEPVGSQAGSTQGRASPRRCSRCECPRAAGGHPGASSAWASEPRLRAGQAMWDRGGPGDGLGAETSAAGDQALLPGERQPPPDPKSGTFVQATQS